VRSAIEREVKLEAPDGFVLPDLSGTVDGVLARVANERDLDATYYDTPDLRLARWGVSVRHRSGDGTGWTVKLPEGDAGPALVRRELLFDGAAGAIPPGVSELLRAYVRSSELSPAARVRSRRVSVELVDAEGERLAEVVDDDVQTEVGPGVRRFRELEVEVDERADPGLLEALVAALLTAGAVAVAEPVPKVVRALGAGGGGPPARGTPRLGPKSTAADVVRAALIGSAVRILQHDPGVRIGDDPEDVHQARVRARRLRSDLRTFRSLLVDSWREPLEAELRWLGQELGAVRDADVLLERLRRDAASLPERDARAVAALVRQLVRQREAARASMLVALSSDRYVALLDRLVEAVVEPQTLPVADKRAGPVLARLVQRPWKRLERAVKGLGDDPPDEDLHQVRILAKRCRYAAEAAAGVAGKPAARLGKAVADLQGVLGDHQDAVVAEGWLRANSRTAALVAGELIAVQRLQAAACRAAWPAAWKRASRKRLRKWMR
jgi:CHAD domain-containing protein